MRRRGRPGLGGAGRSAVVAAVLVGVALGALAAGAVRLEDHRLGFRWLQIPAKSMLLNSRLGHRVLDECRMAQQQSS